MIGPEQLDIFIPLHRGECLRQWAGLAVEHRVELEDPGDVSAFADWLRDHGHTPPGMGQEAVTVLVAVMNECERETLGAGDRLPAPAGSARAGGFRAGG